MGWGFKFWDGWATCVVGDFGAVFLWSRYGYNMLDWLPFPALSGLCVLGFLEG